MDDPVTWLRAQLGEDERVALATGGREWHSDGEYVVDDQHEDVVYAEGRPSEDEAEHIARHDPKRVLAEVAAKRLLLDLHGGCDARCYIVRVLALPYADRDGYDESWRP